MLDEEQKEPEREQQKSRPDPILPMISIFEEERDGAPDTEKESFIEQQKSAPILLDQSLLLFSNES